MIRLTLPISDIDDMTTVFILEDDQEYMLRKPDKGMAFITSDGCDGFSQTGIKLPFDTMLELHFDTMTELIDHVTDSPPKPVCKHFRPIEERT